MFLQSFVMSSVYLAAISTRLAENAATHTLLPDAEHEAPRLPPPARSSGALHLTKVLLQGLCQQVES